eukprot:4661885-Alexandrium_andersonii.AAC.1
MHCNASRICVAPGWAGGVTHASTTRVQAVFLQHLLLCPAHSAIIARAHEAKCESHAHSAHKK